MTGLSVGASGKVYVSNSVERALQVEPINFNFSVKTGLPVNILKH
jgi:hypothetical protein